MPLPTKGYRAPFWTPEEDSLLREFYPKYGTVRLATLLNRSREGIGLRAKRLGIECEKSPPWTSEQDGILRQRYQLEGPSADLQSTLGRTRKAIQIRTCKLGILMPDRYHANRNHTRHKGRYGDKWAHFKGLGVISGKMMNSLMRSARDRGKSHSLLLRADVKEHLLSLITKECPLSGRLLKFKECSKDRSDNASLDRINPNEGYEEGNIRWIDRKVNYMKRDMTDKEFLELVWEIARKNPPPFQLVSETVPIP